MKTSISLSLTIIILSCFFMSCNNESTDTIKPVECEPIVFSVIYQIEIINNTNSAVTLSSGYFGSDEKDYALSPHRIDNNFYYTIAGDTTEKMLVFWYSMAGFFTTLGEEEWYNEFRKENLKNFIGLRSFFLRIGIDDCEYYMAGWPESLDLPPFIKSSYELDNEIYDTYILDTSKIIQHGLGYSVGEGEIRVKTNPAYGEWFYRPMIIRYFNDDGQIVENDFDDTVAVYGKTVLTIDAPDKIMFKMQELSSEPSEDMVETMTEWLDEGRFVY